MSKISEQNCVPCEKQETPLNNKQSLEYLRELDGWVLSENGKFISHEFIFKNFKQSLEFVNKVGAIAESQKHHPDITFGWGYVTIKIQTHNINGLHKNDFILAGKISEIV